ncbi:MAG: 3-dehydroquinate synthase [Prevotellaceae bacterium]|jgi:3-dehydroquinate synthase|nr:3-dehydroquinate synthase [Prevotellaceae bacterium]
MTNLSFFSKLKQYIQSYDENNIFVLTDKNVDKLVLPKIIDNLPAFEEIKKIVIYAGENSKNIDTVTEIWRVLTESYAERNSLLINIGGGAVSDIGGFAAATFKRGIDFINIPTTLLAAVDASIGGKTGVNFFNCKNQIGVFAMPKDVIVNVDFFDTLDDKNLYAGYAEMLKYGYIYSRQLLENTFKLNLQNIDQDLFINLINENIFVKNKFVTLDRYDMGNRQALNFGHTFGHAFESLSLKQPKSEPLLHGEAVAWGMVCELLLSHLKFDFDKDEVLRLHTFVKENYPALNVSCAKQDKIYELMKQDKKNALSEIKITLLKEVGQYQINQTATKEDIFKVLDYLC